MLTQNRKSGLVAMEWVSGFQKSVMGAKGWQGPIHLQYKGATVDVYRDSGDSQYDEKINGILTAMKTVINAGFALPDPMKVYCTGFREAQNRAFHFDANFNYACNIVLGSTCVNGGSFDLGSISSSNHPGFSRVAVTCIHEIGHSLHCLARGLHDFHDTGLGWSQKATHAAEVSQYAGMNKKEFVAEVFAGCMIGRTYSPGCMQEYSQLQGPHTATFP